MSQSAHAIVQQSYSRCLRSEDFFGRFYELLLASDPVLPDMFSKTEFPRQHRLLQHGIGLLISYGNHADDVLLERIAARHSAKGLDVPPDMYPLFVQALIRAISEADPRYDDDIEQAWRDVVTPGIQFMMSRYDA